LDYRSTAEKRRGGSTKSGGGAEGEEEEDDEDDDDDEEEGEENGREEDKEVESGLKALASIEGEGSGSGIGGAGVDDQESGKDDMDEGLAGEEATAGQETKQAEEREPSSVSVDIKKVSGVLGFEYQLGYDRIVPEGDNYSAEVIDEGMCFV
jgi:hypothetical protein